MKASDIIGLSGRFKYIQEVTPGQVFVSGKRNFRKAFGQLTDADINDEINAGSNDFTEVEEPRRKSRGKNSTNSN